MTGAIISKDIIVPSGNVITLTDAPVSGTSAANKSYVDSQIIVCKFLEILHHQIMG